MSTALDVTFRIMHTDLCHLLAGKHEKNVHARELLHTHTHKFFQQCTEVGSPPVCCGDVVAFVALTSLVSTSNRLKLRLTQVSCRWSRKTNMDDKELSQKPCDCHVTCHSSKGEWHVPAVFATARR